MTGTEVTPEKGLASKSRPRTGTAAHASSSLVTVLPGDDVTSRINSLNDGQIKLGTGLAWNGASTTVVATLAGRLYHRASTNTYMVLNNSRRYHHPKPLDRVLGIIEDRMGPDYYRVNIFGPHPATLHNQSFEGATKRNKPNLQPGSLIYCRVKTAPPDMDPEVTCLVEPGGDGGALRKDWMAAGDHGGTYGELHGGSCIQVSLGLARELLLPTNVLLDALGNRSKIPFEICIGVNGMVWVHSQRPEYTILVLNAVKNSEVMTEPQVRGMVRSMISTVHSIIMDGDEQHNDED